jgi:uncharacterized damage-inducible protein DinB
VDIIDIRFLHAYDRWATRRVLETVAELDVVDWPAGEPIGERHLGEILVHVLGAHQRWRHGLAGSPETPRPEREPLPAVADLAGAFETEWSATDGWLDTLDDGFLAGTDEGIPIWQMLAHLVNHGTQHRSEAAALLTAAGRSPGDLDMIRFSEELAGAAKG